jgi:hypothetical protein
MIFTRPHLGRTLAYVIGIVFSAMLMIGSIVLFFLRPRQFLRHPRTWRDRGAERESEGARGVAGLAAHGPADRISTGMTFAIS